MALKKVIMAQTHSPEYLLHKYWARKPHNIIAGFIEELVPPGGVVADPFCGSGVVLREAQKLGRTAYGFDVNPAACLISSVLTDPPDTREFVSTAAGLLDQVSPAVNQSYSENGRTVKYCVHAVVAACGKCGCLQRQSDAVPNGRRLLCSACGAPLHFNLEHLADTELVSVWFEGGEEADTSPAVLEHQKRQSARTLLDADTGRYCYPFAENRRILAYRGMTTRDLFTPRNFSILCRIADLFSAIEDRRVRQAAQLLLSASAAQCSRLIASRNNLSTGGPAWSIPGFWVPAVHLETNPLVHLRARLKKFSRGLEEINRNLPARSVRVEKLDGRLGLDRLTGEGIASDLVFFDPPYGDNVPYVEFSAVWNSFLRDFPGPEADISVSDRLPGDAAWAQYGRDIHSSVAAIRRNLKPDGRLLITFNNNDMRAWRALLSGLQENGMCCEFATYQIPAVVSSKAQKAIDGSFISDIYSIYKKSDHNTAVRSLTEVSEELTACAKFRGGIVSRTLARRTMLLAWLKNNVSADLLDEQDSLQKSLFAEENGQLRLKGCRPPKTAPFVKAVRKAAQELLQDGPCQWRCLYERAAAAVADYGIPDPHEVRAALDGCVSFDGTKCAACIPPEQTSLFDTTK